jgi:hypothetical protein
VIVGDRLHDPNWVAVNVNTKTYLPAPLDKIARLTYLAVQGATLSPKFSPEVKAFTVTLPRNARTLEVIAEPTSTRSKELTLDDKTVQPGMAHEVKLQGRSQSIRIGVTSPDGSERTQYTLTVKR